LPPRRRRKKFPLSNPSFSACTSRSNPPLRFACNPSYGRLVNALGGVTVIY
jgi:hypothetical protein